MTLRSWAIVGAAIIGLCCIGATIRAYTPAASKPPVLGRPESVSGITPPGTRGRSVHRDGHAAWRPDLDSEDGPGEDQGVPETKEEQITETPLDRLARLENELAREPRDGTWAKEAEWQLQSALDADEFQQSRVEALNCASTMCRLSVLHDDETAFETIIMLPHKVQFLPRATWVHDRPSMKSTFFFVRDGHVFPSARQPDEQADQETE